MPAEVFLPILAPSCEFSLSAMGIPLPDLLCADARVRIDVAAVREALVFAFAAGGAQQAFDDLLASTSLPPSSWRRTAFARDLYVDEIVEKCLAVHIGGRAYATSVRYVARVLGEPPRESRDVELRREVLTQLASSPAMREELERIYLAVLRLRGLLCAARQPAPRVRRVEILRVVREAFELCAGSFAGATPGLARLREFGAAVVASEGHRRLVALLDHDDHMASLDLSVRVGADGEVRAMQIVAVRERRDNPFYLSVLRRLFARLALMLRGYRTTSGEVAERLLSEVFAGVEDSVALLFQLFGDAQVYLGALGFRDRALDKGLAVSLPVLAQRGSAFYVEGLYNPLLLAAGVTPVPCDLSVGPDALVVVTGPNSGGKTRLLQAVAIAQLFCETGLFAPARAGQFPRASGLFASLFEEARADQPEGHLGMELLRIRRLFDEMDAGALVVIDELCSGTNPSEGEEIARLVLSLLPELGVRGFVTTHLLQFAASLARDRPTASLEFLQVELDEMERPTYRFVAGVARTSLAHKTAARLGVTREELLERIEAKKRRPGHVA